MKLKIGMFGFGRTGSVVAKEIISDSLCDLAWVIRRTNKNEGEYASKLLGFGQKSGRIHSIDSIDTNTFYQKYFADVIIDFSVNSAVECYKKAAVCGTRIVTAISKYEKSQLQQLNDLSRRTAVLYSPNITLGVNFLIEISKVLQSIMPDADIEIIEEHFKGKADVSGTAMRIAQDLRLDTKKHINSIRVGGIVGKHEVVFGMPNQTIRIVHESINRAAFGQGAIFASKWLMDKGCGIYTMEEAVMQNAKRNNIMQS